MIGQEEGWGKERLQRSRVQLPGARTCSSRMLLSASLFSTLLFRVLQLKATSDMPLYIRVPTWAVRATATVNGGTAQATIAGTMFKVGSLLQGLPWSTRSTTPLFFYNAAILLSARIGEPGQREKYRHSEPQSRGAPRALVLGRHRHGAPRASHVLAAGGGQLHCHGRVCI